jgi:hypothetical protein
MAILVTQGMLQQTYSWKATGGDNPNAIRIDARLFNRHEGYEVVPMIQKVVNHLGAESEADVQRIEALIGELPDNVRGRKKVFAWLVQHAGTSGTDGSVPQGEEPGDGSASLLATIRRQEELIAGLRETVRGLEARLDSQTSPGAAPRGPEPAAAISACYLAWVRLLQASCCWPWCLPR